MLAIISHVAPHDLSKPVPTDESCRIAFASGAIGAQIERLFWFRATEPLVSATSVVDSNFEPAPISPRYRLFVKVNELGVVWNLSMLLSDSHLLHCVMIHNEPLDTFRLDRL